MAPYPTPARLAQYISSVAVHVSNEDDRHRSGGVELEDNDALELFPLSIWQNICAVVGNFFNAFSGPTRAVLEDDIEIIKAAEGAAWKRRRLDSKTDVQAAAAMSVLQDVGDSFFDFGDVEWSGDGGRRHVQQLVRWRRFRGSARRCAILEELTPVGRRGPAPGGGPAPRGPSPGGRPTTTPWGA